MFRLEQKLVLQMFFSGDAEALALSSLCNLMALIKFGCFKSYIFLLLLLLIFKFGAFRPHYKHSSIERNLKNVCEREKCPIMDINIFGSLKKYQINVIVDVVARRDVEKEIPIEKKAEEIIILHFFRCDQQQHHLIAIKMFHY